jgi:NADH dehydrogenase
MDERHRVVVVGAGFGGLFATKALRRAPVDVTLINSTAHHLFQPLLYQVATGILSEGEIAPPIREVLRRQRNAEMLLGTVTDVDVEARTVTASAPGISYTVPYDSLIVAAGSAQSYFGNDGFAAHAPGMKSIDDALELRGRIFTAFELAELETDQAAIDRWLTFVVVGAGPTGVEMAGQIAELAHRTLPGQYRRIDPRKARVILVDAVDAVLSAFGDHLSTQALRQLHKIGVEVELETKVVDVDATGIEVETARGRQRIEAMTKMWAAGVSAPALTAKLAKATGAESDRAGRIRVNPDCTVPGHPEIFAIGDMMALDRLPGVAQVAIQSGRHAADQIKRRLRGQPTGQPFRYFDKGSMATISRFSAVASVGKLRFSGFVGWLLWLAVHLLYLVGFKNRVTAVMHWAVSFIGSSRSERSAPVPETLPVRHTE